MMRARHHQRKLQVRKSAEQVSFINIVPGIYVQEAALSRKIFETPSRFNDSPLPRGVLAFLPPEA